MIKTNYFEIIEASPDWNERQIANHVRSYGKVEATVKQEAMRKLLNPQERMNQELKTFHAPDYSAETPESERFYSLLDYMLQSPGFSRTISTNLTYYLYDRLVQHPLFTTLRSNEYENQSVYADILRDMDKDVWISHSLALLYERCALFNEEEDRTDEALRLWEKAILYWMNILSDKEFFKGTSTCKNVAGTPREDLCRQVWEDMPKKLLDYRYDSFKACMDINELSKACTSYKIVAAVESYGFIKGNVLSVLDKMQSDLLREADAIFFRGRVKTGFTGDYEEVFVFLGKVGVILGNVERLLLYEAGKFDSYFFELKTSKSFEIAVKKLKDFKALEKKLNEVKRNSSQQFIIEQDVKAVYDRIQDLAIECANSGKHRMAIEFFKALPADRLIPVGQEKKTIQEVISMVEIWAINSGDYWRPEDGTKKPAPQKPPYVPQTPKPQTPAPTKPSQTHTNYGAYQPRKKPAGKWIGVMAAIIAALVIAFYSIPKPQTNAVSAVNDSTYQETQQNNSTPAVVESPVSKVTNDTILKVGYYGGYDPQAQRIKALMEGMTAKNPNIRFKESIVAADYNQFITNLPVVLAAGDAPDIIFSHPRNIPDLVAKGNFMDLTGKPYADNFYDITYKALVSDGKLYAIPLDVYSLGVFYNKDVFDSAKLDVPVTATGLFNVCETLKSQGYKPFANNFADNTSPYVVFDTITESLINANPGMINAIKNGTSKYGDFPEFRSCIEKYSSIMKYSEFDTSSTSADIQFKALANGAAGMYVFYSSAFDDIIRERPDADIGFFGFPYFDDSLANKAYAAANNTLMVNSLTQAAAACDEFLAYVASEEGADTYTRGNNSISAVKNFSQTSAYQAITDLKSFLDNDKVFTVDYYTDGFYYADGGKCYNTIISITPSGSIDPDNVIAQLDSR